MHKKFKTLQEYHDTDQEISFRKHEGKYFRVGLLSETSSDVTFTSTGRNGLVLDLFGTRKHLTRMDGILDEKPTRPGDVFMVPPSLEVRLAWEVHAQRSENIVFEFDTQAFEAYVPEFGRDLIAKGHLVPRGYAQRPVLASLVGLLGREVDPAQRRGQLFADSVLRLLIMELASSEWSVPLGTSAPENGADLRVTRAIDFIEAHYAEDISLSEISQASGLSTTQLTARFQQHTGITPYSYVINRRLSQAEKLLSSTDMPISHVAVETGFSDQQHLTRVFRARLKKTPRQVRNG